MREVRFGSGSVEQRREFADHDNDALTNFARMVTVFDTDPAISAAWVQLHLGVGTVNAYVISWTKTSDETRTKQGRVIPPEEWNRPAVDKRPSIPLAPTDEHGRPIKEFAFYDATIRIRRDRDWQVKAFCEKLDGMRVRVQAAYVIETDRYHGEMCMKDRSPEFRMQPAGWMASGDLVDWIEVSPGDPLPDAWPKIEPAPVPAKARSHRTNRAYL